MSGWRDAMLGRVRGLILSADPRIIGEVKWRKPANPGGVPAWSCHGLICTGETYRDKVKLTFAHGAALDDRAGMCNAPGTGNTRRAIGLHEEAALDDTAFVVLVKAVARNELGR